MTDNGRNQLCRPMFWGWKKMSKYSWSDLVCLLHTSLCNELPPLPPKSVLVVLFITAWLRCQYLSCKGQRWEEDHSWITLVSYSKVNMLISKWLALLILQLFTVSQPEWQLNTNGCESSDFTNQVLSICKHQLIIRFINHHCFLKYSWKSISSYLFSTSSSASSGPRKSTSNIGRPGPA